MRAATYWVFQFWYLLSLALAIPAGALVLRVFIVQLVHAKVGDARLWDEDRRKLIGFRGATQSRRRRQGRDLVKCPFELLFPFKKRGSRHRALSRSAPKTDRLLNQTGLSAVARQ